MLLVLDDLWENWQIPVLFVGPSSRTSNQQTDMHNLIIKFWFYALALNQTNIIVTNAQFPRKIVAKVYIKDIAVRLERSWFFVFVFGVTDA